jgi:SOS-response transcriptional repressor LexA
LTVNHLNISGDFQFAEITIYQVGDVGAGMTPVSEMPILGKVKVAPVDGARPWDRFIRSKVSGDSLKEEDILDGDQVVLKITFEMHEVKNGVIVAAMTPVGLTLKRFFLEPDPDGLKVRLCPANPAHEELVFDYNDVEIQALLVRRERVKEF